MFESLLGPKVYPRIGLVPHLAEMIIRTGDFAGDQSDEAYNMIGKSLVSTSFLQTLLSGLYDSFQSRSTTGPNRKSATIYGVAETDYFSVIARLALANPRTCLSAITSAVETAPEDQIMKWLLDEWFFHFDNIGDINRKKLHALALTHLLAANGLSSPPPPYLLDHLQSYLTIWTDVITELSEGTDYDPADPRGGDYLINWNSADQTYDADGKYHNNEPPETTRRRAWNLSEPIHKINIRDFVTQHLRAVVEVCGGNDRFRDEWLVNVDREVVSGFGQLGIF